jgi:RND superfamily putative drug exporter
VRSREARRAGGDHDRRRLPDGSPQAASTSNLLGTPAADSRPQGQRRQRRARPDRRQTAIFADFSSVLSSKLPLFIGVVVLLSFLLLTAVFRSLVIPRWRR